MTITYYYLTNMGPKTQKKPPRTIYQYDKANKTHIKDIFLKSSQDFSASTPEQHTVEENWAYFKNTRKDVQSIIPTKI